MLSNTLNVLGVAADFAASPRPVKGVVEADDTPSLPSG